MIGALTISWAGSATSRLALEDVPEDLVRRCRLLRSTGISRTVSRRLPEATLHAVALARRHGPWIGFDSSRRPGCGGAGWNRRPRGRPRPGRGRGALAARVKIQELEGEP